jgi:aminoglycoside 3-N-acetyltransferase
VTRRPDRRGFTPASEPSLALTRETLVSDLRTLGVRPGQTLLVHASLRKIGWVIGGAATVVAALLDSVGETGTVVMPTPTEENSTTSRAYLELTDGMSPREVAEHKAKMPPFDRLLTPTIRGGLVAEALRTTPGAVRSDHPQSSFAAVGAQAARLMAGHERTSHLGEESPLGALYALGEVGHGEAMVLLLGPGYESCTALHLAEYRYTARPPTCIYECVISVDGERRWDSFRDVVLDDTQFVLIGLKAEEQIEPDRRHEGRVGNAECRLLPLRDLVDFATVWLASARASSCT